MHKCDTWNDAARCTHDGVSDRGPISDFTHHDRTMNDRTLADDRPSQNN